MGRFTTLDEATAAYERREEEAAELREIVADLNSRLMGEQRTTLAICDALGFTDDEREFLRARGHLERMDDGAHAFRCEVVEDDPEDVCGAPDVTVSEYGRTPRAAVRKALAAWRKIEAWDAKQAGAAPREAVRY